MSILLFFKKTPKDSTDAVKISSWLLVAALATFAVSLFLSSPINWVVMMVAAWIMLDSTLYLGWSRGWKALEDKIVDKMLKDEEERLTREQEAE